MHRTRTFTIFAGGAGAGSMHFGQRVQSRQLVVESVNKSSSVATLSQFMDRTSCCLLRGLASRMCSVDLALQPLARLVASLDAGL